MNFFRFFILFSYVSIFSQESRPIATAFSFLLLGHDAVACGKGDIGVASLPDTFCQYWNASKYVFNKEKSGIAMNYTPYLNKFTQDIFIGSLSYYKKSNRGAWASSLRYFNIGDVTLTYGLNNDVYVLGSFRPSEFTFDVSYNLQLSEHYAMGVTARFLNSNLRLPTEESYSAKGLSFDLSGYYLSKSHLARDFLGKFALGFQLSNVGDKIRYETLSQTSYIPTNLKIGGGYFLETDSYNTFSFLTEFNKLLIPSPTRNKEGASTSYLNTAQTDFLREFFALLATLPMAFQKNYKKFLGL